MPQRINLRLVAALDDEVISEDEWAMLENLRTLLVSNLINMH